MKKIINIIILFLLSNNIFSQQSCDIDMIFLQELPECKEDNYYLVFEDNFDGNTLDIKKWEIQPWGQGALYGNGGGTQEYNTLDNIEVSNGTCKIIAKKENVSKLAISYEDANKILQDGLPNLRTYYYTSSNIWTKQVFGYGKFEIRCKLPNGKGFFPAFWTFGGQRWNEIDIFEIFGDNIDRYTCNVHHDYDGDGKSENCSYNIDNYTDFSQWHVFTCIYDFDKIIWKIDGNTVRTLYRYFTISGKYITCEDNIAQGIYAQQKSYPIENMSIIMNLAIINGNDAPDNNTIFPNTFEIDYVRYYKQSDEKPCDGCFDNFTYENTSQLPLYTKSKDFIKTQTNVTVKSNQNVNFKAKNSIILQKGFTAQAGCNFNALIEDCNLFNKVSTPITFIGHNLIENSITKCINPLYSIEISGVIYYSFMVYNMSEQLVYQKTGSPNSNKNNLWNTISFPVGWYKIKLQLLNCDFNDEREYNIYIQNGNCKKINSTIDTNYNIKPIDNVTKEIVKSTFVNDFTVYPNPTNEKLSVFYSSFNNNTSTIIIIDINGKELFKEQKSNKIGANKIDINVDKFSKGVYVLRIETNNEKIEKKFIISN